MHASRNQGASWSPNNGWHTAGSMGICLNSNNGFPISCPYLLQAAVAPCLLSPLHPKSNRFVAGWRIGQEARYGVLSSCLFVCFLFLFLFVFYNQRSLFYTLQAMYVLTPVPLLRNLQIKWRPRFSFLLLIG